MDTKYTDAITPFQHTAARRRLAFSLLQCVWLSLGFNTQPPEGGWINPSIQQRLLRSFNTQPPEGGWEDGVVVFGEDYKFQHTAARRRLASLLSRRISPITVSTHSRPKAAGQLFTSALHCYGRVSTHSRPKAAGRG